MKLFRVLAISATCALGAGALGASVAQADTTDAGKVNFTRPATSSFDSYTASPSASQQQWMRDHYWRMRTYAPYFNSRLAWYSNAWSYKDLYAIYTNSSLAQQHPEWILRDSAGHKLYIPWGCSNGTCPQYAADIGNPDFRAYWISQARDQLSAGYKGLFVDDVNMELRVGNGSGSEVAPTDPRSGQTMPLADWRRYTAQFTEAIRTAFPDKEIVHNALWFSGHSDPYVARELKAADYVDLERGVNDSGITAGAGTYGYETLQSHIDWLHSNGVGVVFDTYATTNREREYNLASYFLTSNGNDAVCTDSGGTPDDWYKGNDAQLGAPQGPRYSWNGVLRRDFANGTVLVNEPNKASKTLSLPGTLQSIAGQQTSSVTLGGGQGVVLQGASAGSGSGGSATTSVTKRSVRLAGRVQGARRGRVFMRITHRRAASGRWVTVHRSTATLRSGRYRKLVRLARGHYRLSVSYHGPSRRLNGAVGRRSLTVR